MSEAASLKAKYQVTVNPLLSQLVPAYLRRRDEDVIQLRKLLAARDFEGIQGIGHKLSGNGATYGFHQLSHWGNEIETAAQCKDFSKLEPLIEQVSDYIGNIEII